MLFLRHRNRTNVTSTMPAIVAKTDISPNYTDNLYYCKNGSVYAYNKKSKKSKVLRSNVFRKKEGHGYVLKKSPSGKLIVVERSLAAMRKKARASRSRRAKVRRARRATTKKRRSTTTKRKGRR